MAKKQGAHILVIDDEPYIREIIKRGLKSFDYRFKTAENPQEAIEQLNEYTFDLALCDIKMPHGDGISVLKHIKLHYENTPVIMLTGVCEVNTAIDCLRCGATNYLIKPIDLTCLAFAVKEALEKRGLILENREYQLSLENKVAKQTDYLRRIYLDSVKAIANCLEAKDIYTRGHSKRVTEYAMQLAKAISAPPELLYQIQLSGLLHDIGKIGIPECILNKPNGLSVGEFDQIKQHPDISTHILKPIIHDEGIIANIKHHHEMFNGKGYPDGKMGDVIPLGARILSVADAFDAMTSNRAYRKAMSMEEAVRELERNAGTQFDADLIDPFIRLVASVSSLDKLWQLSSVILEEGRELCITDYVAYI